MANDLVLYSHPEARAVEKQLALLSPTFADVLGKVMSPERLIRTVMVSLSKTPKLYECNRETLFMAAMSAACLGLEVDGVTGQGFLVPFAGRAQLLIGYLGYNTVAGRSGYTIRGNVVRDGDAFDFDEPEGVIHHKRRLDSKGRIIAAWAKAVHATLPPVISVLSLDELLAVKAKSQGAKKSDSPWNDPDVGFPAMCSKTAKRRLRRCMPLNLYQLAAGMDEAVEERGLPARVDRSPDGGLSLIVEDTPTESPFPRTVDVQPSRDTITPPATGDFAKLPAALITKAEALRVFIRESDSVAKIDMRWKRSESVALLRQIKAADSAAYDKLVDDYDKRRMVLVEREEKGVE